MLGEISISKNLYEKGLEIKNNHYGKGHIETVIPLFNLANVYN